MNHPAEVQAFVRELFNPAVQIVSMSQTDAGDKNEIIYLKVERTVEKHLTRTTISRSEEMNPL